MKMLPKDPTELDRTVLWLRVGESVMIGPAIELTVTEVAELAQRARVGVDAPRSVTVDRHEIHLIKQRRKREGAR